eukprot:8285891-Alexandrium_andersonii.AAC.1
MRVWLLVLRGPRESNVGSSDGCSVLHAPHVHHNMGAVVRSITHDACSKVWTVWQRTRTTFNSDGMKQAHKRIAA